MLCHSGVQNGNSFPKPWAKQLVLDQFHQFEQAASSFQFVAIANPKGSLPQRKGFSLREVLL